MRTLSKAANKTFERLTAGLVEPGDHRKVDNTGGVFMPVSVDVLFQTRLGPVIALSHYYEQNADLCADPSMEFLVAAVGVFPLTFRQDIPPVFTEAATIDADGKIRCAAYSQRNITTFANTWLRNIRQQQYGQRVRANQKAG